MKKIIPLKTQKRTINDVFIGFHVSKNTWHLLNLLCAANGYSRSRMLRSILLSYIEKENVNEMSLCQQVLPQIINYKNLQEKGVSIEDLHKKIESEFTQIGISPDAISFLIKKIK